MFCTARTGEGDAYGILRLGADDSMPKPIRYMEFMAQVHALLRRRTPRAATLQLGSIKINSERGRIRLAGADVDLTQREYKLGLAGESGLVLSSVYGRGCRLDSDYQG